MKSIVENTGAWAIGSANHLTNLCAFVFRLFALFFQRSKNGRVLARKAVVEQIYFTAVQALPIIIPIALMLGTAIIIQFSRFSGEVDIGTLIVVLLIRELGPVVTALIVILRSSTAVTIEISSLVVFNEIEAMEMAGADPMRLLAFPRFAGITSAVFCLFIVFDIVAIFGGYTLIWLSNYFHIHSFFLLIARAISGVDLLVGFLKAMTFGVIITTISLYHGFNTPKAQTFIPVSASKAAVESFFWCMAFNLLISAVFYL